MRKTTKTTTGSPLRLRKRELFRSLGYEPHAGQVEVHRSEAQYRVLACGARWGKSTCAAKTSTVRDAATTNANPKIRKVRTTS